MIAKLSNNQVGWKDNILDQKEMNVNINGEEMLEVYLPRYSIAQWCRRWYFYHRSVSLPWCYLSLLVFSPTQSSAKNNK